MVWVEISRLLGYDQETIIIMVTIITSLLMLEENCGHDNKINKQTNKQKNSIDLWLEMEKQQALMSDVLIIHPYDFLLAEASVT